MALAQALLVGPEDHRHVGEGRHRGTHRGEQQHVLRRVRHVVVAADHVRDRHVHVVAHHRQVIDRQAVAADDDEVVDHRVVELDRSLDEVGEGRPALGHLEADRPRRAVRGQLARLRLGQRPLAADVAPHLAARLGGLARLVVLLGRREVVVGVAGRDQLFGGGSVPIEALRLEVRSVRAADVGPFVPVHAEPAHPLQDAVDHLVRRSLGVGVLDAQHEHAALAAGEEPVEQRGAGAADVQVTGGRWGETYANHNSSECNRSGRPPYRRYGEQAL